MQHNLDDIGGAMELALYRLSIAKEDLEAAEESFESGHLTKTRENSPTSK